MGHQGYVNSTRHPVQNGWGVADLSVPERVGRAVTAGTDIIADTNDGRLDPPGLPAGIVSAPSG